MHTGRSDGMIRIIYDDNGTPTAISSVVPADNETIKSENGISEDC